MVDNPFAALAPGSAPAAAPPEDDNPFAALAPQGSESDETTVTQIGRGILAAPVSLAQGLFEFGAAGVDAALDTSYSKGVTERFEGFKESIGGTPTSTAGKVAEELVAFGLGFVPIAGWLGRASAVAKNAKVGKARNAYQRSADIFGKSDVGKTLVGSRARLAATTALSVGAFEGVFSDDGRRTVSDHFAVLPEALRTDDTEYLTGAEEGYRRLQNRVRFFTEGVAIGALAEAIGPAVAATTRGVASVPGARSTARLVNEVVFKRLGQNFIGKSSFIRNNLTTAGATPEPVFEALVDTGLISRAKAQTAVRLWQNFDNALLKTMNGMKMFGRGRVKVQKGYDDVMQFLSGNRSALDGYDQSVIKAADDMRVYLDDLSAEMYDLVKSMTPTARFEDGVKIGSGITREEIDILLREFEKNKGSYIRRRYEAFLNPGKYLDPKMYKGPEFQAAVTDVARIMRLASEPSAQLSDDVLNTRAEEVILEMITGARRSESGLSTEDFLAAVKSGLESKRPAGGRVPVYGLSDRIFRERTDLLNRSVPLRKFLGEIRDPQQAFMQTVSAMADVEARYSLYSNMRNAFAKDFSDAAGKTIDQAPLIVSGGSIATKDQENLLTAMGYVKLGDEANLLGGTYGQMTGDFVKPEIYNALTIQGRTQNAWNEVYAVAMQAKGLSQMSKTALNFPLGTIRNFMSGIFMTGANGNIPKNFDFHEALQLTFGSMADLSDDAFRARWEKVRRLGLADEDLDIALVRELLQEGTREGDNLAFAAKLQGWIDKGLNVLPFVRRLENLYAGTDTFWKVFSHTAETGKLSSALRRAGLDESDVALLYDDLVRQGLAKDVSARSLDDSLLDVLAADIVKATMPTYSRVPNFVRTIRRIPVTGNFIAFPAEIIRTSGNILQRSLSEMSFVADDAVLAKLAQKLGADAAPAAAKELQRQIRAIGSQRLSSYV